MLGEPSEFSVNPFSFGEHRLGDMGVPAES
jgi:hypothetical protein